MSKAEERFMILTSSSDLHMRGHISTHTDTHTHTHTKCKLGKKKQQYQTSRHDSIPLSPIAGEVQTNGSLGLPDQPARPD